MAKKYVVTIYSEDGSLHKNFTELSGAVTYMCKQSGHKVSVVEVQGCFDNKRSYSVTDDWGRVIEVVPREVGYCKVCKKSNQGLVTVVVDPAWQQSLAPELRVREVQYVKVCTNCYNDFECGIWGVHYINGKHKVYK